MIDDIFLICKPTMQFMLADIRKSLKSPNIPNKKIEIVIQSNMPIFNFYYYYTIIKPKILNEF